MAAVFVGAQGIAAVILISRLLPGRSRIAPVEPAAAMPGNAGTVSVLVATLDEAERIGPCLAGLARQSATLREVLIVDSHSTDGTIALVEDAARADPRIRLIADPPLPDGWVGKVWALQHGLEHATGDWVLGIDADTAPSPGLVDAVLAAARRHAYDIVSFAPTFAGQTIGERWLQPALLATLVYRFGAPGARTLPGRIMANGQCFLARRDVLLQHGGYASVRGSFADDISLARRLARAGVPVGFLDGSRIITVRAYRSGGGMWREWGRSIDAKDAATPTRQWLDVVFLALVLGAPVPVLLVLALGARGPAVLLAVAAGINLLLLALRCRLQGALSGSYERRGVAFWLSPLADPLACIRIVLSNLRRPRRWRGRSY